VDVPLSVSRIGLLSQNYPNPFRSRTSLQLRLSRPGPADLRVYDLAGREVLTLLTGHQTAGTHVVAIDGSRLAPGIYWYRAETEEGAEARKMVRFR
jgi:hypothetical protein